MKDLQIKCQEKSCDYLTKRRDHFKRYHLKRRHHAGPKKKIFRKKKWKFLSRKQFKGKTSKICFVCRKPGYFAKNFLKKRKQQNFLNKHKSMQKTLPSQMQNHFFHLMMTTLLKLQWSWLIPHQKKIQTRAAMMPQTHKSKPFIHPSLLQLP